MTVNHSLLILALLQPSLAHCPECATLVWTDIHIGHVYTCAKYMQFCFTSSLLFLFFFATTLCFYQHIQHVTEFFMFFFNRVFLFFLKTCCLFFLISPLLRFPDLPGDPLKYCNASAGCNESAYLQLLSRTSWCVGVMSWQKAVEILILQHGCVFGGKACGKHAKLKYIIVGMT